MSELRACFDQGCQGTNFQDDIERLELALARRDALLREIAGSGIASHWVKRIERELEGSGK